jgi:hypothetical protein
VSLVLSAFFIYWPTMDTLPYLVQGDTGRDLYAYQKAANGALVYRDFWWNYGPLMPYYYALFFKVFGDSIHSIILGRIVLNVLSGCVIYFSLSLFTARIVAILGALWFWVFNQDFTYTFSHTGGVLLILLIIFFVLRSFIHENKKDYLFISACLFLLFLVKINMGFAATFAVALSVLLVNYMRSCGNSASLKASDLLYLIVPTFLMIVIYGFFLWGLPGYYIKQCFPFFPGYDPAKMSIFKSMVVFFKKIVLDLMTDESSINTLSFFSKKELVLIKWFLFISSSCWLLVMSIYRSGFIAVYRKHFLGVLIIVIFIIMSAHEFLLSGTLYRLWWVTPASILFIFFLVGTMLQTLGFRTKLFLCGLITALIFQGLMYRFEYKRLVIEPSKNFLPIKKACVYVGNSSEWLGTVLKTVDFIDRNLAQGEPFLMLPYEPLFFYLTGRSSPVPEIIFFDHLYIPREQEERIISDMNIKKVRFILISTRSESFEKGLGFLGITYCPVLGEYIKRNFVLVRKFGNCEKQGSWIEPIGINIYQRVKSQSE